MKFILILIFTLIILIIKGLHDLVNKVYFLEHELNSLSYDFMIYKRILDNTINKESLYD